MAFEVLFGAWVATGLTLFIMTFLYQDNPLFKVAEHLYVGVSVGYEIVRVFDTVIIRLVLDPIMKQDQWILLVPVGIGLLMLTRYVPKIAWLSRYAFAFLVGVGAGLAIPRTISSFILKQIEDTVRPVLRIPMDNAWEILASGPMAIAVVSVLFAMTFFLVLYLMERFWFPKLTPTVRIVTKAVLYGGILLFVMFRSSLRGAMLSKFDPIVQVFDLNSMVVLIGVATVLFYFLFTVEHSGTGKAIARMGVLFLMISFGAAFGYTVMARMSLLIGRLTDLIEYSSPAYHYATLWLVGATILALGGWSVIRKEPPPSH